MQTTTNNSEISTERENNMRARAKTTSTNRNMNPKPTREKKHTKENMKKQEPMRRTTGPTRCDGILINPIVQWEEKPRWLAIVAPSMDAANKHTFDQALHAPSQ